MLQVATLKAGSLRTGERLRAITEKNQELAIEAQNINQHNQMRIKCIGELTVACKRSEGIIEQLRHRLQTADSLSDIPVPDVEKVLQLLQPLRLAQCSKWDPGTIIFWKLLCA